MCDDRLATATDLLRQLRQRQPTTPVRELAAQAVDATFCSNLQLGSDALTCQLDRHRTALISDVLRRAGAR